MKADENECGSFPPLPGQEEAREGHQQTKAKVVPQDVVIIGPPRQRVRGIPREHFNGKAQAIEIWNNTRDGDERTLPAIQPGCVSDEPASEKMGDRAHLEPLFPDLNVAGPNITLPFSQQLFDRSSHPSRSKATSVPKCGPPVPPAKPV